jgi:dipeptidase E
MARNPAPSLKLVLYSGGQSRTNHRLHAEVVRLAHMRRRESASRLDKEPLSLTYIPYTADGAAPFFDRAIRRYRAAGIERFFTLEPDHRATPDELHTLHSSDVIYLAGGNTYTFLHLLRKSGLFKHVRQFAKAGGVLAGLSAGAILMTPSIGLAGVPSYDADENEMGLRGPKALQGLGLVDFEFSPHDSSDPRRQKQLQIYADRIERPVFSVGDGGGLVVEGENLEFFGKVRVFAEGKCWKLR